MVWYFHESGRKPYGTDTSRQRHDHARRANSIIAIAGFALSAERRVGNQPENSCEMAEASDCQGSENWLQRAALNESERNRRSHGSRFSAAYVAAAG